MSVEAAESDASLTFDVACRVQQEPDWLGSSYRWESPGAVTIAGGGAEFGPLAAPCRLLVESVGAADTTVETAHDRRLRIAAGLAPGALPRTFRWKYRVEIAD